jgi:NAD dependent epimerase/dehydratase family
VRVLLTGGAGFIGSHVAEHLLAQGYEVAIIDDLSSGKRENLPTGARFYEANIRSGCGQILEEFKPEALSPRRPDRRALLRARAASWTGVRRYHSPWGSKRRFGMSVRFEGYMAENPPLPVGCRIWRRTRFPTRLRNL